MAPLTGLCVQVGPQAVLQGWIRPRAVLYDQERLQTVARSWERLQSGLHGQADLSGCVALLGKIAGWTLWLGAACLSLYSAAGRC